MTVTTGGSAEVEPSRAGVARPAGVRNGRRRARQSRTRRVFANVGSAIVAAVAAVLSGAFLVILAAYYTGGPFGIGAVVAGLVVGAALVGVWIWRTGWPIRIRRTRGGTPR